MSSSNSWHTLAFVLGAGWVLGTLTTLTWSVVADSNPTTDDVPKQLPYQGVLEFNGEPLHATGEDAVAVTFALYDGPDAMAPVYSQQLSIEVFSGRFTALIGPVDDQGTPLTEVIRAADDLRLGMTLLGDVNDPNDDVEMTNRQRILPTPYALWSTSATAFTVATDLNVGGLVTAGGVRASAVETDALTVRGASLVLGTNHGIPVGSNTAQRALAHEAGDMLNINVGGDFEGGTRIDGDVTLGADVTIDGDLTLSGALEGRIVGGGVVSCTNNSGTNLGCSRWGAADCGGSGCRKNRCSRGTLRTISGTTQCYSNNSWDRACYSILCIE